MIKLFFFQYLFTKLLTKHTKIGGCTIKSCLVHATAIIRVIKIIVEILNYYIIILLFIDIRTLILSPSQNCVYFGCIIIIIIVIIDYCLHHCNTWLTVTVYEKCEAASEPPTPDHAPDDSSIISGWPHYSDQVRYLKKIIA